MTQVWMLRNSDTDVHVFNRFEHLEPSVRISYSACTNVEIDTIDHQSRKITFRVKGKRGAAFGDNPVHFEDLVVFECWPVWTEPCHL